jgi:signal transduction histidine kinase/Tfp pilus assembly protein PilF
VIPYLKKYLFLFVLLFGQLSNIYAQTPKLDSLKNLISVKTGADLLNLYVEAGKEYLYIAPLKSVECGEKILALAKESSNHSKDGMANLLIGAGYLFSGNFEKGKQFTDAGLKIAKENKNVEEECTGLNSLAVFYMNTGDYKQAVDLFHQTRDKAVAANLTERAAMVTFNIGAIYTNQGKLAEGLNEFQEALKYFTAIGNNKFIARTLMNIAVNYQSWGNYDKALNYYLKADKYFENIKDKIGRVASLNNIGEVYKDKGSYSEAIKYYTQSLDMAIGIQSKLNEAVAYIGLAEANLKLNNIEKAHRLAHQSLELFEPMEMLEGISRCKWVLSEVEFRLENYSKATILAKESAELAQKAGIPDIVERVTSLQSKIMARTGDYKQAYRFLQKHDLVKDSLYNDRQTKRLSAMQSELDLKLKENEIVLLQKENEIKDLQIKKQQTRTRYLIVGIVLLAIVSGVVIRLNRERKKINRLLNEQNIHISEQHEELIKVNETKNRFLSIIGHDLRNPIGAFSEMLGQIVDSPEIFPEELRAQILKELRKEADSTFYLLENLLSWARTQKENIEYKPELIHLKSVIDNNILLNSRFSENKGIQLVAEGEYDYMVYFDINMLNLILRNLISNAIKFSYPEGFVRIKVVDERDIVRVCVIDEGIGIDEKNIPFLFDSHKQIATYGTANEKGSGLGLVLCHEFIKKDGGEITVTSKKGKGTAICFTLRKTNSAV